MADRRLVWQYIKEKRADIIFLMLMEGSFLLLCYLYEVEQLKELLYGVVLSFFFAGCFFAYGYWSFQKRCTALWQALNQMENLPDSLPEPDGRKEEIYQQMMQKLFKERRQRVFEMDKREQEMQDYYTLWVHQIKTPIAAMKLLLQSEEQHSLELVQELFKIEQYAQMALYFMRLQSISSDLVLKEYELYDIVKQAVKKYGVLFLNKKMDFKLETFSKKIITDEKWLCFVIEQLFSNAIKYGKGDDSKKSGGIHIYLEQEKLVISDRGIGIRREDLPRIFERGFTGYNGRMDKKSTGLGLYLTKKILEKLSHTISVESELGKGTRVVLDFSAYISAVGV